MRPAGFVWWLLLVAAKLPTATAPGSLLPEDAFARARSPLVRSSVGCIPALVSVGTDHATLHNGTRISVNGHVLGGGQCAGAQWVLLALINKDGGTTTAAAAAVWEQQLPTAAANFSVWGIGYAPSPAAGSGTSRERSLPAARKAPKSGFARCLLCAGSRLCLEAVSESFLR